MMWGGASAQPEAAWQQGFMWCGALELEWGLLQVSGEATKTTLRPQYGTVGLDILYQ